METVAQVTALCVVGALLGLVLKKGTPELALLLTLCVLTWAFLRLSDTLEELVVFLRGLAADSGVSAALFSPLYKIIGIALVVKAGSGLCQDAGESALASVVETAGSVCALLAAHIGTPWALRDYGGNWRVVAARLEK